MFNGTGDSGDSIMHYLFARFAFRHPLSFLDSWAKPLYVALASPFAQFDFSGIKIFNSLNTVISMLAAYLIAKRLNMNNSWFVPVILILGPMNFVLALSGLTEPLFATILAVGLCCLFYNHSIAGLIILSFLPFVRSEGLFLLVPVALYLLLQKKPASALWLVTGQLFYAIVGYSHFHNLLWFYHNNPYSLISSYGHGEWNHYFDHMPIIAGSVTRYLLEIGFIAIPLFLLLKKETSTNLLPLSLIWVLFATYFFFHVVAWRYGLFNSFGMLRIISGVSPLIAIISVYGYNKCEAFIKLFLKWPKSIGVVCATIVIAINLVFMVNAIKGEQAVGLAIKLSTDEVAENKIAAYIKNKYPDYKNHVYFKASYLCVALDVDPYDLEKGPLATRQDNSYPANSLFIWDDWFAGEEGGITPLTLNRDKTMVRDTSFSEVGAEGKSRIVTLYLKK